MHVINLRLKTNFKLSEFYYMKVRIAHKKKNKISNYSKPSAAETVENVRMLIAKLCSDLMDLYR